MGLLTQVAERDPEVLAIGLAIRDHFESRISRAIVRWQAEGLAYSDLDPGVHGQRAGLHGRPLPGRVVALGLDYDEDKVADTLSTLWVRSLGLADGPRRPT